MDVAINLINRNNSLLAVRFVDRLWSAMIERDLDPTIVLVDDESDDGSFETISGITDVAVQESTTRGEARNRCLDLSDEPILVDCLDTDQLVQPVLFDLLEWYRDECPEYCVTTNGCMLNRRDLVEPIGFGEHQIGEDKYLWDRLIERSQLRHVQENTARHMTGPDTKSGRPVYRPDRSYPDALHEREIDPL